MPLSGRYTIIIPISFNTNLRKSNVVTYCFLQSQHKAYFLVRIFVLRVLFQAKR